MKHFTLICLCIYTTVIYSQNCLPAGIIFDSQIDINNFAVNYPGCTAIDGNVTIEESMAGNITSLAGLAQLLSLNGDLIIQNNTDLHNLNGLENINFINGELSIKNNEDLENVAGLNGFNSISSHINIENNPSLNTIAGLSNLFFAGGNVTIFDNDA